MFHENCFTLHNDLCVPIAIACGYENFYWDIKLIVVDRHKQIGEKS